MTSNRAFLDFQLCMPSSSSNSADCRIFVDGLISVPKPALLTAYMALDFGIPFSEPLDLALLSLNGGTRATTAVLLTLPMCRSFVPALARLVRFLMLCLLKSACWSKG